MTLRRKNQTLLSLITKLRRKNQTLVKQTEQNKIMFLWA